MPNAELPDWVTETPEDNSYRLYVHDEGGESLQEIDDITRSEYIALKLHLARMRGYKATNEPNDVLVNAGVDVNYQGISIEESGHRDPDDEELLRMDADGDEIVSVMPPMDIGSTVNVLLHHEADPLIASRLLRKIAVIIETKGISTESLDCHTQHATVALQENHVKSLRVTLGTLRESEPAR